LSRAEAEDVHVHVQEYSPAELAGMLQEAAQGDKRWLANATRVLNQTLERGDKVAVYQNRVLGHPELGHRLYLSYGSPSSQLGTCEPPEKMPDIGGRIGWRYRLQGVVTHGPVQADGAGS
jgi:hypothetical protein